MGWFSITSTVISERFGNVTFALSVDGIDSLEQFQDELAAKSCVIGRRYRIERRENGPSFLHPGKRTLVPGSGIGVVTVFRTDGYTFV